MLRRSQRLTGLKNRNGAPSSESQSTVAKQKRLEIAEHDAKSGLEWMPAELIEKVAVDLTISRWSTGPYAGYLCSLRLTCRAIKAKTHRLFVRVVFATRFVDFSWAGLQGLQEIANHPEWRFAVQTLCVVRNEATEEEYGQLVEEIRTATDEVERKEAIKKKSLIDENLRDRTFLETGGMGGLRLAAALETLPNVHTIDVEAIDKREPTFRYGFSDDPRTTGSTTVLLTTVLNAVVMSPIRLKSLLVGGISYDCDIGAAEDAFHLPDEFMVNLHSLQEVSLTCTHVPNEYAPTRGTLSRFLRSLPAIKKLHIGLDTVLNGGSVLDDFARLTHPASTLEELHLEGVHISLLYQANFLQHHAGTLKTLSIVSCNLEGDNNQWKRVFQSLKTFEALRYILFSQLSENCMRTQYSSVGCIREEELGVFEISRLYPNGPFTSDDPWVVLGEVDIYQFVADEWDNIPLRLQELIDDVEVDPENNSDPIDDDDGYYWKSPWLL